MRALDTNILARFLLRDDPAHTRRTDALLASGERFSVSNTVLLELAWVLRGVTTNAVATVGLLRSLVALSCVAVDDPLRVRAALDFAAAGGDIADALHIASATDASAFITFDERLVRRARARRTKPRVDRV